MTHFEINRWSDYVRGVTHPDEAILMEQHLHGCSRCAPLVAMLTRVWSAAGNDRRFEPPAALVASAERVFPAKLKAARSRWPHLEVVVAEMVVPGLAPVGARSNSQSSQHTLYKAGNICVDVRLEKSGSSVNLVGQLADETLPEVPLKGLSVILVSRDRVIGQTTSNDLGEFSFFCEPKPNLVLRVPMAHVNSLVEVSLNGWDGEK